MKHVSDFPARGSSARRLFFDPELASRAELIDRIDLLQGKVDELTAAFAPSRVDAIKAAFGVSSSPAKLLLILSDGVPHTKEALLSGLYFDRPDDPPELKIIDVFVCKLRSRLAGSDIKIETIWGSGYRLSKGRDTLARLLSDELPPPDPVVEISSASASAERQWSRPYGSLRDRAISWLWHHADQRGRVTLVSREFSTAIDLRNAGSVMVRNLERGGFLRVLSAPARGPSPGRWNIVMLGVRPE